MKPREMKKKKKRILNISSLPDEAERNEKKIKKRNEKMKKKIKIKRIQIEVELRSKNL